MPAPRKSSSVKALAGTRRNDRNPKAEISERLEAIPKPPKFFSAAEKAEWKRLAPAVVEQGTLTAADMRAFEMLVKTLATETQASAILATEGFTVATGVGGRKPHPCVRIMETARAQARGLLSDFGLTPRGRQGVDVRPPGQNRQNPFEAL